MTGLFTYRKFSLQDTPSLDGLVAVVTGGQAGIGQEIVAQLLLHGIKKVFVIARSANKYDSAREEWRNREGISLGEADSRVEFVECDLGDITSVRVAAESIKRKTEYIHIVVCNAGLGVPPGYKRSAQNIEMVFATNCVGHQVLVILLLPLLKNAVLSTEDTSDARIIVTSSSLHLVCRQLNLDLLTSPARIKRWPAIWDAVWRYGRSKLGNILFANELSRRLQQDRDDPASKHIYVNAYFPGNIATDQWLAWSAYMGKFIGGIMSRLGSFFGQSLEEGAATAIYLAASERVREQDQRGQYFVPIATPCEPSSLARNTKLARDVWDWIDAKAAETLGSEWQQ